MPTTYRTRREVYERLTAIETSLETGIGVHRSLARQIDAVAADVKSLLASRSFSRGAMKMAMIVAGLVSTLVSVAVAYIRSH